MEITVKVQVGITQEVGDLLRAVLGARCHQPEIITEDEVRAAMDHERELEANIKRLKESAEAKKKAAEAEKDESQVTNQEKAEKPAEAKKEAPNEAKETPAPVTYSAEDTREAMHRCRTRFEGEGYKDNTEGEGYLKYHKKLTQWFKYLASTSGAADSKPSSLTAEQRKAFIDACDNTILNDEGNFSINNPF